MMTPAQIEEAQRLAREWLEAHPQQGPLGSGPVSISTADVRTPIAASGPADVELLRQPLAGDPVSIAIKTVVVSRSCGLKECLRLRMAREIPAVLILKNNR